MSNINKENYQTKESGKTEQIIWKITNTLSGRRFPSTEAIIAALYVLKEVQKYNNPSSVSFENIINGLKNSEYQCFVKEYIGEQSFNEIKKLQFLDEEIDLAIMGSESSHFETYIHSTPDSIIKLAQKLLQIQKGESVADICCGHGNFLISSALEYEEATFKGYELNSDAKVIAQIKADLVDGNIKIKQTDVFSINEKESADKIFSNYPFGMRMKELNMGNKYLENLVKENPNISKATSSDWVFNSLICRMMTKSGKAVAIMTNGSTWNKIDSGIRASFIQKGLIEMVIALPERMFQTTSIPTTMIVFSNNNKNIRMIDATNICEKGRRNNTLSDANINEIVSLITKDSNNSKTVSLIDLENNDYALSLNRYINDVKKYSNGVEFKEIIKNITRGAGLTAKQLDELSSKTPTNNQYLMLGNIKNGLIEEELPYLTDLDERLEKYCLKSRNLILSKNGYPYKVAVAEVKENQKILANGNLFIIELDESKVDPYYLKAFFDSEEGIAVLKSITVGATIPNIGQENLLKIRIPMPPLDEQKKIANEYQSVLDEIDVLKLKLNKATEKLHSVFENRG